MATVDNTSIVRQMYEAFNDRDLDRFESFTVPDARSTLVPFGIKLRPREHAELWANAFSDGRIEPTTFVAQGDLVVAEFTGRGTHTGPLRTPAGEIPATHRRVELPFIEVFRIRNGKVVESRSYFDVASMLAQLGVGAPQIAPGSERGAQPQPRH
jgi:steroid delta-isomerase-like uncharacterized protein